MTIKMNAVAAWNQMQQNQLYPILTYLYPNGADAVRTRALP